MSDRTHRASRLALASLLMAALVAQLVIGLSRADLSLIQFFSLFSILANTLAAAMLAILAWRPDRSSSAGFSTFRGAVTVYMSVTGLVYATVLAPTGIDIGLSEPWVNWALHVVGPLGLMLDWVVSPPETRLAESAPLAWLGFPAAYLIYTLIRGAAVDWYPYPFLDPGRGGYGEVAIWCSVSLIVTIAFGYAYWWWANRQVPRPVPA